MNALSVSEVLALPAMTTAPQAFAAVGVSDYTGYELVRNGEFPIEPVRIGRSIKFRRTNLLAFLGLEDDNGAGAVPPTPSVERNESTSQQTGALMNSLPQGTDNAQQGAGACAGKAPARAAGRTQ